MYKDIIRGFIENEKLEIERYCGDLESEKDLEYLESLSIKDIENINKKVESKMNDLLYETIKEIVYNK